MGIEINIDDYLSEEEKKEIAIDVFRQQVKSQLFKSCDGTVQSDSEVQRIIGNITHEIVFKEVQKYIPDVKEQIQENVKKSLSKKDLSYYIFRTKDLWDKEEGLGTTYLKQAIKENELIFKNRIKEVMANYDLEPTLTEEISSRFEKLAETMYGLSDLFHNKNNK